LNFGIGVFDINNLKKINDSLGHESGDAYIVNCCQLLCKTFKNSPVYRIGGDEFAVLLMEEDFKNRDELLLKMKDRMKEIASQDPTPEERVSIAGGIAVFDPENDLKVADVFTRADAAMYDDKVTVKKEEGLL
jgi:diguanylate cyclase (GGDEF)-like protein